MSVQWEEAFVRATRTKRWHIVQRSEATHLLAHCGVRLTSALPRAKAQVYDRKTTWRPTNVKMCLSCLKGHVANPVRTARKG